MKKSNAFNGFICATFITMILFSLSCSEDSNDPGLPFVNEKRLVLATASVGVVNTNHTYLYNDAGQLIENELVVSTTSTSASQKETHVYSGNLMTVEQVQMSATITEQTIRREQTIVNDKTMQIKDYDYFGSSTAELETTVDYSYNLNGQLTERESYSNILDEPVEHDYFIYEDGKMIRFEGFDYDDNDEQLELTESYDDYVYEGSQLKEFKLFIHVNGSQTPITNGKWVFKYNNSGRLSKVTAFAYENGNFNNPMDIIEATYDSDGYVTQSNLFGNITNYTYEDGKGNLRSIIRPQELLFNYPAPARLSADVSSDVGLYIINQYFQF